jgi:hypothetical protein
MLRRSKGCEFTYPDVEQDYPQMSAQNDEMTKGHVVKRVLSYVLGDGSHNEEARREEAPGFRTRY